MTRLSVAECELLSRRECDVLGLVACGLSDAEVAEELGIATSTAAAHMSQILRKFRARNRAHAVAIGVVRGQLQLGTREVPE